MGILWNFVRQLDIRFGFGTVPENGELTPNLWLRNNENDDQPLDLGWRTQGASGFERYKC